MSTMQVEIREWMGALLGLLVGAAIAWYLDILQGWSTSASALVCIGVMAIFVLAPVYGSRFMESRVRQFLTVGLFLVGFCFAHVLAAGWGQKLREQRNQAEVKQQD